MLTRVLVLLTMLIPVAALAAGQSALPVEVKPDQMNGLKKSLEPLLQMTEEQMLALIPTQSGLYFVSCANCTGGQQEGQLTEWSIAEPDVVKCKFCGHAYPSEKYPATGVTEVKTPNGGTARYPYHESRPTWWREQASYRSYFAARVDYHKLHYMEAAALSFAKLYRASNDPAHARRAALILKRFAELHPGYCYHFDYPFQQKIIDDGPVDPKAFRRGFRTARWSWWAYMDISIPLLTAYDLLRPSDALETLGAEEQVRGMLQAMADQILANEDELSNMSPETWADLIRVGRVLQRPEYVHIPLGRLRRMATELFFYDGSWQEGAPSYHSQVVGSVAGLFSAARGYSDPAGYTYPATGERFDDLDLNKVIPEVARAQEALRRMCLPNGRFATVHDTWAANGQGKLEEARPQLLGGLGHGTLGRGKADDQLQAHLAWSPGYGHIHYDGLSLLLFARGQELLSDLGYTHTKWREWTLLTPAHNLVVVDTANQVASPETYGNLRYFHTGANAQIVSVDNPQVYPGVTSTDRKSVV